MMLILGIVDWVLVVGVVGCVGVVGFVCCWLCVLVFV